MAEEILRRGTKLDRYEIREMIGHGGQGQVYRAWDSLLKRNVVIKTLGQVTEEFEKRFLREAEAISSLNHNNVVGIIDYRVDLGRPYIVMEYLRGENLAQRLQRSSMQISEAADVILGVCSGVFACHRRGIIHRDLKPGNIFLHDTSDYGTIVKVLDFGVALVTENKAGDLTGAGQMVGTPRFFSPEQMRHAEVDEKTDQYAIGILLYSALTRRPPFPRMENEALIRAILKSDYPRPRALREEIPEGLENVVLRAMSVEKEKRFASVRELGIAVLDYSSNDGKSIWTGHFLQVPRPLPPPVSMMHIVPTGPSREVQPEPRNIGGTVIAPKNIVSTSATTRVDAEKSAELAKLTSEDPTTVDPNLADFARAVLMENDATPLVPNRPDVVVPIAPLDEGNIVKGPVGNPWTDTRSFSGERSLNSPTIKHASGTLENGVHVRVVKTPQKPKPHRFQLILVIVLASMVGGMLAWVWSLANKDRETESPSPTMIVSNSMEDAGQDANVKDTEVPAPPDAGAGTEVVEKESSKTNIVGERNKTLSVVDNHRERKPKSRPAKRNRPQIEYTSDGSPILE